MIRRSRLDLTGVGHCYHPSGPDATTHRGTLQRFFTITYSER